MGKKVGLCFIGVAGCLAWAALVGILAVPGTALAKKPEGGGGGGGGGKKQEINVAVTFRDSNVVGEVDRVQSDLLGPYIKERKVKAFIGMDGQWRLSMWDSRRSLRLDFTDVVDASGCPPFLVADLDRAGMATLGEDDDGDGALTSAQLKPGSQGERWDLTLMTPGSSARIGLRISFSLDGIVWFVRFGDEGGVTDLVTVVGGDDLDGDGFSDSWDIEAGAGDLALAALFTLEDLESDMPCNFALMPFAVTVVKAE